MVYLNNNEIFSIVIYFWSIKSRLLVTNFFGSPCIGHFFLMRVYRPISPYDLIRPHFPQFCTFFLYKLEGLIFPYDLIHPNSSQTLHESIRKNKALPFMKLNIDSFYLMKSKLRYFLSDHLYNTLHVTIGYTIRTKKVLFPKIH